MQAGDVLTGWFDLPLFALHTGDSTGGKIYV